VANAESGERLRDVVDRLEGEVAELRRSRKRLAEAANDDRRAIERVLHDGVQQYLVAFAIDLRRLSGLLDRDRAAAKALLDELAGNARAALEETAELAQRIYPPLLESRGLASALRSASEGAGVTLLIEIPSSGGYPSECIVAIYWSCVDALSSASRGSQAIVRVLDADGALTFEIAIVGHLADDRLERLRDRIEALDGRLSVESKDLGSRVHGWLPLSR
jgi:signal transduction histidine kinase